MALLWLIVNSKKWHLRHFLVDNMCMDWFTRVKEQVRLTGTTIEAIAASAGLTRDSYNSYRRIGNLPRADEAVAIAKALGTSVEFLVTGIKPLYLTEADKAFLDRAKSWKTVLMDLEDLEPAIASSWVAGIHGAAEAARAARQPGTQTAG